MTTKVLSAVMIAVVIGVGAWAWWMMQPHKIAATATCGEAEAFQSDLGIINVGGFSLGGYFVVNTENDTAFHLGFLDYSDADIEDSWTSDSLSSKYGAELSISFAEELQPELMAQVTSLITASTQLRATNVQRHRLNRVARLVAMDSDVGNDIREALLNSQAVIPFVVHAVVEVDALSLGITGGMHTDTGVQIVKLLDVELSVDYQCSETFEMIGSNTAAFFKVTPIGYDETTDRFYVDTAVDIDFRKVNFAQHAR